LAFVDTPDPDNFAQLIALHKLNPGATVHVVITGRPLRFDADKSHQNWDYDLPSCRMAQEASALRVKNFLKHFGIAVTRVFDGGIAPRTLVPHWIHFEDYYKFFDNNNLKAIRYSEVDPQEDLIKILLALPEKSVMVAVGGPMTGLYQLIVRHPEVASRFKEVHAMFATWGNVSLMDFGDKPRGAVQFNAACDPQAAHFVLMGLDCPIYLMPTEVTRVADIGFINAQALKKALPSNAGSEAMYTLYCYWYDAAVKPRQEKNPNELIFIHDLVAALSLDEKLRNSIYNVVPISIERVPYLPTEQKEWGMVMMKQKKRHGKGARQLYAATCLKPGGAEIYLDTLRRIFA
jgi:inosine-uridine nucleoside N-ribohydrolase